MCGVFNREFHQCYTNLLTVCYQINALLLIKNALIPASSIMWYYVAYIAYIVLSIDQSKAYGKLCSLKISRGTGAFSYNTSNLTKLSKKSSLLAGHDSNRHEHWLGEKNRHAYRH